MTERTLEVYLASPRGFCAGVKRAITIVEESLKKFGAPVYVRHEIVHNKRVIQELKSKGAVFVDELKEVPDGHPVIFSAHGVSRKTYSEAASRRLATTDATCPLVAKVHEQIRRLEQSRAEIIIIGKRNHPEIIGTVGQLEHPEKVHIINSAAEAEALQVSPTAKIGYVTQTTLSVDDTKEIIAQLQDKFPNLSAMSKSDICFATTNRQNAVKALLSKTKNIVILGSANSSNSKQLKETALKNGAEKAFLIDEARELNLSAISGSLGISAGASAPDELVDELLLELRRHYDKINIHKVEFVKENVCFKF